MPTLRGCSVARVLSLVLCAAGLAVAHEPAGPVTFSEHVAPILYKRCVACHHPGTTAPMSLLTYKDARPWARAIREKVVAREMPPWNADPRYGKFKNDPHLTDEEIDTIVHWADRGAPQGDPQKIPPLPAVGEGWHIGKPDLVLEMPEEFTVPADKELDMQYFILDPKFTEDKWVQAADIVPGNLHVVHHADVFIMEPGEQKERPRNDQLPGVVTMPDWQFKPGTGKAPYKGTEIERKLGVVEVRTHEPFTGVGHGDPSPGWPKGTAKLVKAGSKIVLQVHYHPSGTEEKDRSKVGFIFAKEPPERRLFSLGVVNMYFTVPAGNPGYEVKAEATFLKNVHLWGFQPHMHLRGKDMEFRVFYPNGKSEILCYVPHYDFYMQRWYDLAEPKAIPKGSRLVVTAHFDNSAANKLNPDPNIDVKRGLQTTDEMMNGHVNLTVDEEGVVARKSSAETPAEARQK